MVTRKLIFRHVRIQQKSRAKFLLFMIISILGSTSTQLFGASCDVQETPSIYLDPDLLTRQFNNSYIKVNADGNADMRMTGSADILGLVTLPSTAQNSIGSGSTVVINSAGQLGISTGVTVASFSYIYNLSTYTVAAGAAFTFDSNGPLSGVTHTPGTSAITVPNTGKYVFIFSVTSNIASQVALFVNGVIVPSAVFSTYTVEATNFGQVILSLHANDVVTLVNNNTTLPIVSLEASVLTASTTAVNASMLIEQIG